MKHPVSTSLEESEMARVHAIVNKLHVSESWVIRRSVLRGLSEVEREVLGDAAGVPIAVPAPTEPPNGEVAA
jgi:hypothetical protein